MDFFRMMRGRTPSPRDNEFFTPSPKKSTPKSAAVSPVNRHASRRVPKERSPTPYESARLPTPYESAKGTPIKKKRCPNGSRKNKKGICVKRGSRCPDGTRKNRKTRVCEPKKN